MNPRVIEAFLNYASLSDMLKADHETISNFVFENRSYDVSSFDALIDECPDWSCVIVSHIHVDHVLDKLLEEYCENPNAITSRTRRVSTIDKAAFLHGVGALSKGSFSSVGNLNRLRNKFAHELKFEISDAQVEEFRGAMLSAYDQRLKEREEFIEAKDGKIGFKLLLKFSVIFVEEERLANLLIGLKRARNNEDLKDALLNAQRVLDRSS